MSTIAELVVPAGEFALRRTLKETDELAVEIERVVAHDPDSVMPYVWFRADESTLETVDEALENDPSVDHADLLADTGDERLYRTNWVDDVTVMVHVLTEEDATVLEAAVENTQWLFRVLFPERDALSRTDEFATDRGLRIDIRKIHQLEEERGGIYGLTDAQYETLVAAIDHGYYEIPREMDMEDLSDELGISHQALSERLRRAHRALVTDAIGDGEDDEPF